MAYNTHTHINVSLTLILMCVLSVKIILQVVNTLLNHYISVYTLPYINLVLFCPYTLGLRKKIHPSWMKTECGPIG